MELLVQIMFIFIISKCDKSDYTNLPAVEPIKYFYKLILIVITNKINILLVIFCLLYVGNSNDIFIFVSIPKGSPGKMSRCFILHAIIISESSY